MNLHSEFESLLRAFDHEGVSALVIGSYAIAFHAQPRRMKALELWIGGEGENLEKVARSLGRFGAPEAIVKQAVSAGSDAILCGRPPLSVDIVRRVEGVDYVAALARSVEALWAGIKVRVIGLDDLIATKRAAVRRAVLGREDAIDVDCLEQAMAGKRI